MLIRTEGYSCLAQMAKVYDQYGGNVIAVEEVADDKTDQYGIVGGDKLNESGTQLRLNKMVEKPTLGTAPSNLIITGRYILQPEIFALLGAQTAGAGGEIQITDSMVALMANQIFTALKYQGTSYDCGSKEGFLAANIAYAVEDPVLLSALRDVMAQDGLKEKLFGN
jgi:UTP--glucose-1-phosphate uridylyltransferase